jgi:thioredoxin reductase (NADPH)
MMTEGGLAMTENAGSVVGYDVIIIGGGPGGLTAGLYSARSRMRTLLLEGSSTVSQITVTDLIENYPGIPEIGGFELIDRMKQQALSFGLEVRSEQVLSVRPSPGAPSRWIVAAEGGEYETFAVIVATGAVWRNLGVPGEKALTGRGVSYCATCDGPFYRGKAVAVVGGGDAAIQEALFLTRFAREVTIVHRRDRLRAAEILQERVRANEKIRFAWNSVVEEIVGEAAVSAVRLRDVGDPGIKTVLPVDGVFIFIGLNPNTDFVREVVNRDGNGYIIVDGDMKTSAEGIFACGDCIRKHFRQVVTACGDGATAAHAAELHVDRLKGQAYE